MDEILITPDTCMRYLVWAYYYHDITPQPSLDYSSLNLFSPADASKLNSINEALFRCFDEQSVYRAIAQFRNAKMLNEPCPYPQAELDASFAHTV